jgi:hypothetical protein
MMQDLTLFGRAQTPRTGGGNKNNVMQTSWTFFTLPLHIPAI